VLSSRGANGVSYRFAFGGRISADEPKVGSGKVNRSGLSVFPTTRPWERRLARANGV
jgi:hypothetical protein